MGGAVHGRPPSLKGAAMGLKQRLWDLLSSGAPPELDPNSPVEVADVPLVDGPRMVSALQAAGIDATGIESFDLATNTRVRMRIMVQRSELDAARALVDEVG